MHPKINDTTQIRQFIVDTIVDQAEQFGLEQADIDMPSDDSSLVDAGLLDSLGFIELLEAIEEKYGIEIDLSSYDSEYLTTVEGLVAIVSESQSQAVS